MTDQTINLERFCDPGRPGLEQPFTRGEWTDASDGKIMVRVPRRDDVAENAAAPDAPAVFSKYATLKPKPHYTSAPNFDLPEVLEEIAQCYKCRGKGTAHECPACQCVCLTCHGTGEITEPAAPIKVGRLFFAPIYLSLLQPLPNLELDRPPRGRNPLRFRFAGGEGLLMPCRA